MNLYCTLLDFLNNHDPLNTGDFNYVLKWINKNDTNLIEDLTPSLYCFIVSKILHCKKIGVKLNRVNTLLHVKHNCNNDEFNQMIDEALKLENITYDKHIAIIIMFYFLHIEEYTESPYKIIDMLLDAYHE